MSIKGSKHRKRSLPRFFVPKLCQLKTVRVPPPPPPPPNWCHPKSHFDSPDVSYFRAKFGKERIKANKLILN